MSCGNKIASKNKIVSNCFQSFFALFYLYCSHEQVFGRTLAPELVFHIGILNVTCIF